MSKLEVIRSIASGEPNANALNNITGVGEAYDNVPLSEFLGEAKQQRELEDSPDYGEAAPTVPALAFIKNKLKSKKNEPEFKSNNFEANEEKKESGDEEVEEKGGYLSSEDNKSIELANRAIKTASWGSVFYLITTDILGPSSAPYAIGQLGYVPGTLLFILFGGCAVYTGFLLYWMFLSLDSVKYPLKSYGDLVGRVCGPKVRYGIDLLQSLQLLCNVAVIILGNGQGLSQITKGKGCYTILILVWALIGMIIGQIRTLQRFSFLANLAIWMNVFVIIATMACVAHMAPNYLAVPSVPKGPIVTKAVISGAGTTAFSGQLNACMNIVYSYGGAMVFIEFMAEMRRPYDFWKGMVLAQAFIFSVYLLYGLFVYSQLGQFIANPANQSISGYTMQTIVNVISLVSAVIAAGLYGNVAIKVIFSTLIEKTFRVKSLDEQTRVLFSLNLGNTKFELTAKRVMWTLSVIVYWAVAFVIASAIPEFSALTSLVGAVCILQFTYTFPPFIRLVYDIRVSDLENNYTGKWLVGRVFAAYKKKFFINTFHLIFSLAALATAGLGIYASAELLKQSFATKVTTSFTCKSPVA